MSELDFLHESNENLMSFGGLGIRVLTGAAVTTEHFAVLHAMEDSQVDFTSNLESGDATVSNLSLSRGIAIYGDMSNVNVDLGTVIGYLKKY